MTLPPLTRGRGDRTGPGDFELRPLLSGPVLRLAIVVLTLAIYLLWVVVAVGATHHRIAPGGAPLFYDFDAFYEAGRFAIHGHAASAYDDVRMVAAEHAAFPGMTVRLPWNYPPSLQLLVTPLAALPYEIAWIVWSAIGYGGFILSLRLLLGRFPPWLMLAAPAVAVNLFFGQNGLLMVALVCSGVSLLDRRPMMAGVLLGMMCCKPQFAVLMPLLLAMDGRWRVLGSAVVSQALLAATTLLLFGAPVWIAFLGRLLHPGSVFTSSSSDWRAIPSVLILARTLGLDPTLSAVAHWSVALLAFATAARIWSRTGQGGPRAAAVGAATLLITPYLRAYDFALLAPAVLWLASRSGPSTGSGRVSGLLVASLGWIAPAVLMFSTSPVQYGPLISVLCLGTVAWLLLSECDAGETRPESEHRA